MARRRTVTWSGRPAGHHYSVLCEVRIPVVGLRQRRDRVAGVTTSWELRHATDLPRLVTAYIDG
jgi:hypothetical protein